MLGINPDYGGGDPSADTVIFDFNLPGKEAIVYTGRTPGTTISLPSVSNESTGAVTYKFRGWYTEPVGGSKLSDPLTVEAGTHVYYAQWTCRRTAAAAAVVSLVTPTCTWSTLTRTTRAAA